MMLLDRRGLPVSLAVAVSCLLLLLRFGFRERIGVGSPSAPQPFATNVDNARRVAAKGMPSSSPSTKGAATARFVSGRLNTFDKLDCRRAYDSGVKELAPELATLSWMLKTYHLDESNHYLAVMRLYELVHRHSTEKAGKKEELERTVQSWSRDGAPGSDPDKAPPNDTRDRLETLREIAVRWDQRMAETRSEAGADLQELVGVVDGDWLQAVFGISPQTLPTVFEYVPKGTPAPVRSDPDE
jgi:hypothetical protein